jgi:hypothetical protein
MSSRRNALELKINWRTLRYAEVRKEIARSPKVFLPKAGAMSSTLRATTSQSRNLLSIARLNIAKSLKWSSTCSLVRIDQTFLTRSGGFEPTIFPLFQGTLVATEAL